MASVAIWSGPKCASGAVQLCRVPDFKSCVWHDVVQSDRGGCTLELPADSAAVAQCAIMNVIRITDDPDAAGNVAVFEFRISGIKDGAMLETVVVTAQDLSADLGRVQLSQTIGGVPTYTFAPGAMTPTAFINTYILPALAAAGLTWIALGTVTPTALYSLSWDHSTPGAQMAALESATLYEWWLSKNGDTNYLINLGRRAASGTPIIWVGKNVQTLEREILADQFFYNRATPKGAVLSGETEATHAGQHGWKVSAVAAGPTLTLAHPQAGGVPPIGCDAQLNALVAGVSLDAVSPPLSGVNAPRGFCYDQTRRTIWWVLQEPGTSNFRVFWHDLRDGTNGKISVAGAVDLRDMVYDATRDEILVACNDAAKIERISAGAKTSSGNYACNANPSTLTDLNQFGINQLAVGFTSSAHGLEIVNLATLAHVANLDTRVDVDCFCIYDSGSTRYFQLSAVTGAVPYYSAAYANLGTITTGGVGVPCAAFTAGTIYVITTAPHARSITCSTAALGTDTALGNFDGVAIAPPAWTYYGYQRILPILGSKIAVFTGTNGGELVFLDPASAYAASAGCRAATGGNPPPYFYDATDDLFGYADTYGAAMILYRNGATVPSARLRAVVSSTTLASQQITLPGATKGPILSGQLLEIRADTSDTYQTLIEDPASVATYGPLDAFPAFKDSYKRNYKRDPRNDEWASGLPRWVGLRWQQQTNLSSVDSPKWVKADAQATAHSTAALKDTNETLAAGITTVKVKNLGANRVLQVGDVLAWSFTAFGYVTTRTVADGTGKATIPIYSALTGTLNDGDAVTVWSPAQTDGLGANMVVLPCYGAGGGNLYPPTFHAGIHIPRIANATQAWVRLRFVALQGGANLNTVGVAFGGYGNGLATLTGPNSGLGTAAAPVVTPFTLEQQISLSVGTANGDNMLSLRGQAPAGYTSTSYLVLYLQAIEVYVATASACPSPLGALPGDELVPYVGANDLLFNQYRSTPTFSYTVKLLETDGITPLVGQSATLRDPKRGIAATPRIMRVDQSINRDQYVINEPIIQLESRPQSAMEALAQAGF